MRTLLGIGLTLVLIPMACVQTGSKIREKGAVATVKTKGHYTSAAYCFSREWRKNTGGNPRDPVVEVDPEVDFAEIYFVPGNNINLLFRSTEDGNSVAQIYISDEIFNASLFQAKMLEYTSACQLVNESAETE